MDKLVIITGASRGIGAATALHAGRQGYIVCINYLHRAEQARKVQEEIIEQGGKAFTIAADVSVESEVIRMFETIDNSGHSLHALVNNAGIIERQSSLLNMTASRLHRVFSINVIGSFLCAREAIKRMSVKNKGKGGSIVNISSAAARGGSAFEYVDYAASKGAIDSMTIGLSKELAEDQIRVNAVRPGVIYTEIHASGGEPGRVDRIKDSVPMKRGGQPAEVANAIMWLVSNEASYVTGAFIDVTGGR
jgi:NAD(P)-dependent dehydrogenase (short-subunit alcohol dehydrogenase family)